MWLVYAIAASILWGLDYSLGEKILENKISPITLLIFQMFFGLVLFSILGFRFSLKHDLPVLTTNKYLLGWVILAMITFSIGNYFIFLSIQAKNATIAGLIELSYPLFTIFFTWFLFRQHHVTPGLIVGGILIVIGVIVISYYN
jgi:drug/metabolite transporter (DMT)-like permease